jgi:hypothetical protein
MIEIFKILTLISTLSKTFYLTKKKEKERKRGELSIYNEIWEL